jgi:hypothetical protein
MAGSRLRGPAGARLGAGRAGIEATMTDPLAAMRGDISQLANLDPLERARRHGLRGDVIEQRQEAERQAAARERFETNLMMAEALERQQIASQGYSDRQLVEHRQQVEAARAERANELWAELERVDPQLAAAKRAEAARASQAAEMEATLARARAVSRDPFMRRMRESFHQREIARRQPAVYGEISR